MGHEEKQRAQQLTDAFRAFNEMSVQLAGSYRELEGRVAELNEELAAARSERLRQLAEKERLADRLARLLEGLPGGVVVLDGDRRIQECNPAARELLGGTLLGEAWEAVARRAFEPGAGDAREVRLHNGRRVILSVRPLAAEPGQILLLQDVTEQRALQELLNRHRHVAAMGDMAAGLAHQIRTPLASALLYASNLVRGSLGEEDRRRFAERIVARLHHLEGMVEDTLRFARGGVLGVEDIEVRALLEELRQMIEPQLRAAGGTLEIMDRAPGARLRGSREALVGALHNLAANALQAADRAPRLRLHLAIEAPDALCMEFSDNGPGIPAPLCERVFEPFFTTRPDGTGLGLAVVHAVVQAHHGEIRVESAAGEGARFHIRLPLAEAGAALPADLPRPARAVAPERGVQTGVGAVSGSTVLCKEVRP